MNVHNAHFRPGAIAFVGLLFAASLFAMPALQPLFEWAFPGIRPVIYDRSSFFSLWLSHAGFVGAGCLIASAVGIGLAIAVTRPAGRDFRPLVGAIASVGQTFPPVAVLALAVPIVGFGAAPTLLALSLYGFLPVLANSIAGLDGVSPAVLEAARGLGMSPLQVLRRAELPLAAPMILAGVRTSVIFNIGTATIGSTVGAPTLGTPIISGLIGEKLPFVIQGTLVVGLFAILTDLVFERLETRLRRGLV